MENYHPESLKTSSWVKLMFHSYKYLGHCQDTLITSFATNSGLV